jgi:hypothetical protein
MTEDRPLAVDLFCGRGGWTLGLQAAGFRVVGYDVVAYPEYPGELVKADVGSLDGSRLRGARLVVASPPCTEFSQMTSIAHARGFRGPRDPERGMELVRAAMRVILASETPHWALENVIGLIDPIARELGPPRLRNGGWRIWGNFPGFLMPRANPLWKGRKIPARTRTRRDGRTYRVVHALDRTPPRLRAIVPYAIAYGVGKACLAGGP